MQTYPHNHTKTNQSYDMFCPINRNQPLALHVIWFDHRECGRMGFGVHVLFVDQSENNAVWFVCLNMWDIEQIRGAYIFLPISNMLVCAQHSQRVKSCKTTICILPGFTPNDVICGKWIGQTCTLHNLPPDPNGFCDLWYKYNLQNSEKQKLPIAGYKMWNWLWDCLFHTNPMTWMAHTYTACANLE